MKTWNDYSDKEKAKIITIYKIVGILILLFIIFGVVWLFSSVPSGSSSSSGNKCIFKYSDGSVCGLKTNKYDNFCDYHYENLYKLVE